MNNNQELNEKLAEFAGFEYGEEYQPNGDYWKSGYYSADGNTIIWLDELSPFTESFDACVEWLIPKLAFGTITFVPVRGTQTELKSIQKWGCKILHSDWNESTTAVGDSKNPALSLCKAIEKLIEEG